MVGVKPYTEADERFMRLAIQIASRGIELGQTPFGACIVRDRDVVVTAHNVVLLTTDITAHAEVHAIRLACLRLGTIDLSGCTMYTTCEPCPMCFAACHWARLDRIVFGARIADAAESGFNELHVSNEQLKALGGTSMTISPGCLSSECRALFAEFSNHEHARTY